MRCYHDGCTDTPRKVFLRLIALNAKDGLLVLRGKIISLLVFCVQGVRGSTYVEHFAQIENNKVADPDFLAEARPYQTLRNFQQ